ncbi:hypothetical protein AB0L40_22055 [Patulibacter sp. NPDC049589]|uniref:hypothetical protein n=1 Tax=Patulibacter sp. NPDC049589 TaxID=3154731 RepID=UPI0034379FFF
MWWSVSVREHAVALQDTSDAVESLLLRLDLRVVGGLWSDAGHAIGIARSPAGLFVGWLDVGWIAPDDPFSEMRDVVHLVERVPIEQLSRDLDFAISEVKGLRAEHLRDCERCDERFVPGQMYGARCCHSCAVRDGDVGSC